MILYLSTNNTRRPLLKTRETLKRKRRRRWLKFTMIMTKCTSTNKNI